MTRPIRLAVVSSHPIQYFSPLWRELASRPEVDLTVFYAHRPTPAEQGAGFGVAFEWDVDLLSGYRSVWLANRSERPGVTHFGGCDTPAIAKEIARGRFDAVLVLGWNMRCFWQAIVACWRTRTPLLVRGDSQLVHAPLMKRAAKRLLYPLFIGRFDACLAVGQRSAAYFRHYGARRVVYAPHFVDNDYFASAAAVARERRAETRRSWGAGDDDVVAIFAGKFIPQKQPQDFIRALAEARAPGLRGVLVGEGALRAECEVLAAKLDAPAIFLGFRNQSQMAEVYAAADVLVLPSVSETWGLVVNEAMASGIPAIVSDAVGCTPDLVLEGRTGWSFSAGSVQELTRRLRDATADPSTLRELGRQGASHIRAFSVEAAAAGVLDAVKQVRHG